MLSPPLLLLSLALFSIAVNAAPLSQTGTSRTVSHYPLSNTALSVNEAEAILPRICGTGPPSSALVSAHRDLSSPYFTRRAKTTPPKILIDTYFHVVYTAARAKSKPITPVMIANQFGALQSAYAASSIAFRLVNTSYTTNDSWASDEADNDMKKALRRGNYSSLNIYFQTNLSSGPDGTSTGTAAQVLGYCTLPTNITYLPCDGCPLVEFPTQDYYADGCNVLADTMPNGAITGYNTGKTTVHEVGHWLGLLHTFQGSSCDPSNPGDFIADTPQESVSTVGCPSAKDSCPDIPGLDPTNNYMDYSTDQCYTQFTQGQMGRMVDMWTGMRLGW